MQSIIVLCSNHSQGECNISWGIPPPFNNPRNTLKAKLVQSTSYNNIIYITIVYSSVQLGHVLLNIELQPITFEHWPCHSSSVKNIHAKNSNQGVMKHDIIAICDRIWQNQVSTHILPNYLTSNSCNLTICNAIGLEILHILFS